MRHSGILPLFHDQCNGLKTVTELKFVQYFLSQGSANIFYRGPHWRF